MKLRTVAALPGAQHDRQRLLCLLAGQVQLGGQPAARAAQRVIGWLAAYPAWRFGLQIPLFRAPAAAEVMDLVAEQLDSTQPDSGRPTGGGATGRSGRMRLAVDHADRAGSWLSADATIADRVDPW